MAHDEEQRPGGAVVLGSGAMLGAGVFAGLSPAAAEAGWWLLLGVPIALVAAICSAMSTREQARSHSGDDPAQDCVRERMGVVPARVSASARGMGMVLAMAAIARVAAEHLAPRLSALISPVAVLAVVLVATLGVRIHYEAARGWLLLTAAVLGVVIATCFGIAPVAPSVHAATGGFTGTTGAAAVLFFAFLGFEHGWFGSGGFVSGPAGERCSPLRVCGAPLVVAGVLLVLGAVLLVQLGPERLALSRQPVLDALGAAAAGTLRGPVGVVVAIALLPVLFRALQAARAPFLAAASARELPPSLVRRSGKGTPFLLDVVLGVVAAAVSELAPADRLIPVAACCLLVHYAFANGSARALLVERATWPSRAACLGMGLSVVLVMSTPVPVLLTTLAVAVLGPLLLTAGSRALRGR